MELRIDSNLPSHPSYRLEVKEDLATLTRTQAGWIRTKSYNLETNSVLKAIRKLKAQTIEEFAQDSITTSEETWAELFEAVQSVQISCCVSDQTQHTPAWPGFVDCWNLTTRGTQYLRLSTEIFDHHDSNYHHDACEHEVQGELAQIIMLAMGTSDQKHYVELAEKFDEKEWKELHNSIPSAKDCNWLNQWRG